jgi:acetyltransferase
METSDTTSAQASPPHGEHAVLLRRHAYLIRPVRDTDEPALVDMFARSSPEDARLRCLGMIKDFPHLAAARLVHGDGDREIALAAIDTGAPAPGEIVGVVHVIEEPSGPHTAEFDVMVRTDMKGRGVGFQLMKDILARARQRGLETIVGYISCENRAMLLMAQELGFHPDLAEAGVVRVSARL